MSAARRTRESPDADVPEQIANRRAARERIGGARAAALPEPLGSHAPRVRRRRAVVRQGRRRARGRARGGAARARARPHPRDPQDGEGDLRRPLGRRPPRPGLPEEGPPPARGLGAPRAARSRRPRRRRGPRLPDAHGGALRPGRGPRLPREVAPAAAGQVARPHGRRAQVPPALRRPRRLARDAPDVRGAREDRRLHPALLRRPRLRRGRDADDADRSRAAPPRARS